MTKRRVPVKRIGKAKRENPYLRLTTEEIMEALDVSRTTLDNWRAKGCPAEKRKQTLSYSLPTVVAWRIDQETLAARTKAAAPDAPIKLGPIEDLDREVIDNLRETLASPLAGSARIAAARMLRDMAAERGGTLAKHKPTLVAFVEIANDGADKIIATGMRQLVCPSCGEVIEVGDAETVP
jgi:hypothetical protein